FGDLRPSERAREVFSFCFIDDKAGVHDRDLIGLANMSWECDYPHSDSSWPNSPEALMKHFDGVNDEEIDRITHRNAIERFRFDPFHLTGLTRKECTVGALRDRSAHDH
ncbi:MAG: amidohydrolase family protein, partial [Mycobacteriales bacterium]